METAVSDAVATTTALVTNILTTNVPVVMAIFAGLIGLGFGIKLIKKLIGRKAV